MQKQLLFFILNRGMEPLLFLFRLFTKTSKVLHSSEAGLRNWTDEELEEGDDKGMVQLEVV